MGKLNELHIYLIQAAVLIVIAFGSASMNFEDVKSCFPIIVRYALYMVMIQFLHQVIALMMDAVKSGRPPIIKFDEDNKKQLAIAGVAVLALFYWKQPLEINEFLYLSIAHFVINYPVEKKSSVKISYGSGMACSFFEGYLVHIIPSDGARFVGFEENIGIYEAAHGVRFPVKKLFLIVTKTLYCPPDLKLFNKIECKDLPYLEACMPLEEIQKDVAGVKNRSYKNSAYKIHREGHQPIYLSAECSSPLHTLYRVLKNRDLYDELVDVNVEEVTKDFCSMLEKIIAKSPETRDKCVLIHYDNTDPNENLATILLDKIKELNPNFDYDS